MHICPDGLSEAISGRSGLNAIGLFENYKIIKYIKVVIIINE